MFSFLRRKKGQKDEALDDALKKFKKSSETKTEVVEDLRETIHKTTSDRSNYQLEAVPDGRRGR
jgi:ribosomal protein S21